jgi:hypothetical protein
MNRYQPFNFGPTLGPLGDTSGSSPQGKLVRIPANPLKRGHWGIEPELIGVDEPLGEDPGGSGGGGGGGQGGSGILGGGRSGPRLSQPDLYIPVKETGSPYRWARCSNGRDCCTKLQKELIENTYLDIIKLPCLQANIFPTLLANLKDAYKQRISIRCTSDCGSVEKSGGEYIEVDPGTKQLRRELILCTNIFTDARNLMITLLHELIHAAGGNEIDSIAIVDSCFHPQSYDSMLWYWRQILDNYPFKKAGTGSSEIRLYQGKYVTWIPSTGEVFALVPGGVGAMIIDGKHNRTFIPPNWFMEELRRKP